MAGTNPPAGTNPSPDQASGSTGIEPDAGTNPRPDVQGGPGGAGGHASQAVQQNAKMTGGGMHPGATDTGSSTSPMSGGRGGVGTKTNRTTEGEPERVGGNMAGASGNSVLNTGRPTQGDSRASMGRAAVSGDAAGNIATAGAPAAPQNRSTTDASSLNPGGTTRTGAGTTSVGNIGGGAAGTGTSGTRDRASDIAEGRQAGPSGNLASSPDAADRGTPDDVADTDGPSPGMAGGIRKGTQAAEQHNR